MVRGSAARCSGSGLEVPRRAPAGGSRGLAVLMGTWRKGRIGIPLQPVRRAALHPSVADVSRQAQTPPSDPLPPPHPGRRCKPTFARRTTTHPLRTPVELLRRRRNAPCLYPSTMHDYPRTGFERLLCQFRRLLGQLLGHSRPDHGIGRTSEAVLALAVLCTGLASYTYLRQAAVHDQTTILEVELERRSQQLTSALRGAVELRASEGERIASAGSLPHLPELSVPLLGGRDTLYWNDGFVLRRTVARIGEDGVAGEIVADLRIWEADAAVTDDERLGETGEAALCGLSGLRKICFPSRFQPAGRVSTVATPAETPTDRALHGESGTSRPVDYRGRTTYSAFKPLDGQRLAFVVSIDEAELLAPIQRQLMLGIPVLVLLAAGGVFLIGRQLRPLTAELAGAKLQIGRGGGFAYCRRGRDQAGKEAVATCRRQSPFPDRISGSGLHLPICQSRSRSVVSTATRPDHRKAHERPG